MWDVAMPTARERRLAAAESALQRLYPGRRVRLLSSGTVALQEAIRLSRPHISPVVAVPAYACPDIGTAVLGAGGRLRLYDTDPVTLLPDVDSVRRAVEGATHLVVAHLFGRVFDLGDYQRIAEDHGAVLIEDAAQHAGGAVNGRRGGAAAPWSILSFGRGKGLNGGGGGALLSPLDVSALSTTHEDGPGASVRHLVVAAATELLSNPTLYWAPSAIPALGLGETTFHSPGGVGGAARGTPALLLHSLAREATDLSARRRNEQEYFAGLDGARSVHSIPLPTGTESGALRFPIRADARTMMPFAVLGVARAYPRTLAAYPELAPHVDRAAIACAGAEELARSLHTLPTHALMTEPERVALIGRLVDLAT